MPNRLNPYLSFRDNAREAMTFYQTVFGGKLDVMTFDQMAHDPSEKDNVMHAMLETPNGMVLMGSDTPKSMPHSSGSAISVSLSGDDEALLHGYWDKLSQGAQIAVPLEKAPWGDSFGMLTDRFGTPWMVNIAAARQ